ncbi:MAG: acyl-[ACP]--phospholipid O-acyltransferase [Alphaproteobacteria bacterium]|nr:acyl-[ACP]--phospholipid O-acyltransferase [Alphaproteobacteria bacterium]
MTVDLGLLATRRFLPLFVTQFLGAFNDNLIKNAIVVLIVFGHAAGTGPSGDVAGQLAGAALVVPFFFLSATAGQLADRFDKSLVARVVKFCEIPLMAAAAAGLIAGNGWLLLFVLLLIGAQSTFLGPVKYALLPAHLGERELVAGNGLIESSTFLAILLGTIIGGITVTLPGGPAIVAGMIIAFAVAGFVASLFIPPAPAADPGLAINPNIVAETMSIVREARRGLGVFRAIMGLSWFWAFGAVLIGQLPAWGRSTLGTDEHVFTLFLAVFAIGIGAGSFLCARFLKGEIAARHVPLGALGMCVFSVDLAFAGHGWTVADGQLIGIGAFLSTAGGWRIVVDLFLIALSGGLFTVPLYAILQSWSNPTRRARTIAANNVLNAAMMTLATLLAVQMVGFGASSGALFLVLAALNAVAAVYISTLLPDEVLKGIFSFVFRRLYGLQVRGVEQMPKPGEPAVVVVNHVSLLDGLLLATVLPGKPTFAVDTFISQRWWAKPFLALVDVFTVDPTNPMATKALIRVVREGRSLVIFPEGRITVTGALMKVYEGPGMIADKAEAVIVPVRIDGAQFTPFSYLRGKLRLSWFPRITITILPPRRIGAPAGVTGRQRRRVIGQKLYDIMSDMMFVTSATRLNLFQGLLDARGRYGRKQIIAEDYERRRITYDRFVRGSIVLGRKLAQQTAPRENVALLLPNAVATMIAFFGLHAFGRVPAMLNFAAGAESMALACTGAGVKLVVTSRRFVERAKLAAVVERLSQQATILYLEDVGATIGLADKLVGLVAPRLAARIHRRHAPAPDDPCVVLFTSGTEGAPKGVVLSHANIMANRLQLAARIDFNPSDTVFNALPVFHSFGLTGGALLPMLSGIRTFFYPSPLHYRIVPELVYGENATILFGTDTFLSGYARNANPYDFYSVRYVFAGAEKVRPETRRTWMEKFGLRLLEGYGATETAPVLAVNTPMHNKPGTVGRLLPNIEYRLDPVPGIATGGRLVVRGPNVMLGYLRSEKPGVLEPPEGGWYDTGDIVEIDDDGFVTIVGRAKRFAKIGGEMVSLAAVESWAGETWPGSQNAVVAMPDARKGEQLVLISDHAGAARDALLAFAGTRGIPELMIPRTIVPVAKMPLLGTGKIDYRAAGDLARSVLSQSQPAAAP